MDLNNMKFFILAGGYGVRARPLSFVKPKPLFPLHGVPLIKIMLQKLQSMDFHEGFINLHYKPEAVQETIGVMPNLPIHYLYEKELSGSKILTGALKAMTNEEFLFILNGDVFLEILQVPLTEMVNEIMETNVDGGLLLRKNNDPGYADVHMEDGFFRGTGKNRGGESFMYTGAALFRRKVIEKINDTNFFCTLVKHPLKIKIFIYEGIWLDTGSPRLYFEANKQYRKYIGKDSQSNSFSENVTISADSCVNDCIIWENTTISGGSTLSNCILTGDLSLHDVHYSEKIIFSQDAAINIESLC